MDLEERIRRAVEDLEDGRSVAVIAFGDTEPSLVVAIAKGSAAPKLFDLWEDFTFEIQPPPEHIRAELVRERAEGRARRDKRRAEKP